MVRTHIVEYIFFFGILGATGYLVWNVFLPFFTPLAIAAVVVTVSYPFFRKVLEKTPRKNKTIASGITTLLIALLVLAPLTYLGYLIFTETFRFYSVLSQGGILSIEEPLRQIELLVQNFVPNFSLDITAYVRQAAGWVTGNAGNIFAGTLSTIFSLFLVLFGIFYFFRDGEQFIKALIRISPLTDSEDSLILKKLSRSVRSVVLGTLSVATIQGILTAIGLTIFGVDQPILWGTVAAIGALIPGVGTTIVLIPAVLFLILEGSLGAAAGLAIWGIVAVGTIDNILGPYLMSRGVVLHPFFVLLSVLGGIALFGPIGFVLGPVALSLLMVLLELYNSHVVSEHSDSGI